MNAKLIKLITGIASIVITIIFILVTTLAKINYLDEAYRMSQLIYDYRPALLVFSMIFYGLLIAYSIVYIVLNRYNLSDKIKFRLLIIQVILIISAFILMFSSIGLINDIKNGLYLA